MLGSLGLKEIVTKLKQVRLAMVPRHSQQQPQLSEQLTWNSMKYNEQLLN